MALKALAITQEKNKAAGAILRPCFSMRKGGLYEKIQNPLLALSLVLMVSLLFCTTAFAANGDVAGAIEETWNDASGQIKTVVNKGGVSGNRPDSGGVFLPLQNWGWLTSTIGNTDSLSGRRPQFCSPA